MCSFEHGGVLLPCADVLQCTPAVASFSGKPAVYLAVCDCQGVDVRFRTIFKYFSSLHFHLLCFPSEPNEFMTTVLVVLVVAVSQDTEEDKDEEELSDEYVREYPTVHRPLGLIVSKPTLIVSLLLVFKQINREVTNSRCNRCSFYYQQH